MTRARAAGGLVVGAALVAAGLAAGCAGPWGGGRLHLVYERGARPHPDYYCADCHGVTYFDPYYDLCPRYGFAFDWRAAPQVVRVYRREYVRIRRAHPEAGRYRYREGYRQRAIERFGDDRGRLPRYPGSPERVRSGEKDRPERGRSEKSGGRRPGAARRGRAGGS